MMGGITAPRTTGEIIGATPLWGTDPIIYDSLRSGTFDGQTFVGAYDSGVFKKRDGVGWDDTNYPITNLWNKRPIIRIGTANIANTDTSGAEVVVPSGYDVLWLRVLGDRHNAFKVFFLDGAQEQLGHFGGGFRRQHNYTPDGRVRRLHWHAHEWVPIPVGRAGRVAIVSKVGDPWISGLAFGKNPFNVCPQHAVVMHWNCDPIAGVGTQYGGASSGFIWNSSDWHRDNLAYVELNRSVAQGYLPVIGNGRDKALYWVEHGDTYDTVQPYAIEINGTAVVPNFELRDTPVKRFYSSRGWSMNCVRTMRVPAALITAGQRLMKIKITSDWDGRFHFRELGTHDCI